MFNNEFMLRQAGYFAERIKREVGPQRQKQIERGFALALNRPPDSDELADGIALAEKHGLAQFCRVLLNASEFIYVD